MSPVNAAMGMEEAGWPRETPPTKMTASMPTMVMCERYVEKI
jgi:hypothetical protein